MHIHPDAPVSLNNLSALFDVPDATLTKDIKFLKTQCFSHVHIPLGGREAFGGHVQCRIRRQGFFGDKHTSGMNASQVGEIHQQASSFIDAPGNMVVIQFVIRLFHQQVNLLLGQTVYLTQFPEDGAVPEGGNGPDKCRMFSAIPFKYVVQYLIPFLPGEVDVKVGWTGPLGIDETFKIEIKVNGIHIGNPQAVGNNGVGPAAPSHMVESTRHGISDYIPGDQEIGRKAQPIDDLQLMPDPSSGPPCS